MSTILYFSRFEHGQHGCAVIASEGTLSSGESNAEVLCQDRSPTFWIISQRANTFPVCALNPLPEY